MKILACVKQVPDLDGRFVPDASGTWYDRTDLVWRLNSYDSYAVEQALLTKEQVANSELSVLTVGPESAEKVLRKAMAMGCDKGVHILDPESWRKEPFAIASLIAAHARNEQYELIFTGLQSQDRGSCQVGILLAELLGLTSISAIVSFNFNDGTIEVERELEGGRTQRLRTTAPALFTCESGLNTPRYPTFPNIASARRKNILTIDAQTLPATPPCLETRALYAPEKKQGALVLEGDPETMADGLIAFIKEKTTLLG